MDSASLKSFLGFWDIRHLVLLVHVLFYRSTIASLCTDLHECAGFLSVQRKIFFLMSVEVLARFV